MRKTKVKRGENLKSQKAITLIALVITIIVLLILAAVSIATLTGNNGLLTKASDAKEMTRAGEVEEIVNLWKTENGMSEYNSDSSVTIKTEEELLQELLDGKKIFEEEIDRENKIITIGNKKINYKIDAKLTDIYVALYKDGTLVFSNNKEDIDEGQVAEGKNYGNIKR